MNNKKHPIIFGADAEGPTWREISRKGSYEDEQGKHTVEEVNLERRDGCKVHVIRTRDKTKAIVRGPSGEYATQVIPDDADPRIKGSNFADKEFPLNREIQPEKSKEDRIRQTLETIRGLQVKRARKAFSNIEDRIKNECNIPIEHIQPHESDWMDEQDLDKYSIMFVDNYDIKEDLDEYYYDPDAICTISIGELWCDYDDYHYEGGANIIVELNPRGEIEYEFNGEEIDEEFKQEIIALINRIASTL